MRRQNIPIPKLRLDPVNPRLEGEGMSEDDLIYALLEADRGEAQMIALIDDIVENGLSPIDGVMVMADGEHFVVLEGNRRVAAVKLIADSSRAPEDFPKLVKRLAAVKPSSAPKSISCTVAPSRQAGRHWIERKHTGPAGGAGTQQWGPEQKARFSGANTGQTAIAIAVTSYLLELHPESEELIAAVAKARKKSTNLGRILQFEPFQTEFGIRVRRGQVESTAGIEQDLDFWVKVLNALGELTVSTIHTRDQRTAFVQRAVGMRTPAPAPQDETPGGETGNSSATQPDASSPPYSSTPSAPSDETDGDAQDPTSNGTPTSSTPAGGAPTTSQPAPQRNQPKPKPGLFVGLVLEQVSTRVQALLYEAQHLDLPKTMNTGAILIRVVLELAIDDAIAAKVVTGATIDSHLSVKATRGIEALKAAGVHKTEYGPAERFISGPDFRSLHDYVHSRSAFPTSPDSVHATSANFVAYLRELDRLIGQAKANGNS